MEPVAIIANEFPKVVIPLVESALQSINIIVFDWRWYPTINGSEVSKFNQAICAAAKSGVEVKCLVNNEGIKARLLSAGCDAKLLHSKKLLHTKILIVDDVKVVIGSHNYTQSAFGSNEEASVLVTMPDADNSFKKYFNALWGV